MKTEIFKRKNKKIPTLEYIKSVADSRQQKEIWKFIKKLENENFNNLSRSEVVKSIQGQDNLYELRPYSHRLFLTIQKQKVYLLNGFKKQKKDKIPNGDLQKAINLKKELEDILNK